MVFFTCGWGGKVLLFLSRMLQSVENIVLAGGVCWFRAWCFGVFQTILSFGLACFWWPLEHGLYRYLKCQTWLLLLLILEVDENFSFFTLNLLLPPIHLYFFSPSSLEPSPLSSVKSHPVLYWFSLVSNQCQETFFLGSEEFFLAIVLVEDSLE